MNDGGPAFPKPASQLPNGIDWPEYGMSLRDYFAAAAMQGILSSDYAQNIPESNLAIYAYAQADAMLAERMKSPIGG